MPLKIVLSRPPNWSRLKPYYRRQGKISAIFSRYSCSFSSEPFSSSLKQGSHMPKHRISGFRVLAVLLLQTRNVARIACAREQSCNKIPMARCRAHKIVLLFSKCSDGPILQERKGHINLRKVLGTPAGCPWDTRRDKRGSTGRCPRDFLLIAIEKRTEKAIFAGTPAGCPRDTRPSRGFSEILCDFFLCAFSAP